MKKILNKVSACFYKITYTNCEKPSLNLFSELVPAFRKPPVKVVTKAGCDPENCIQLRKSTNESEVKPDQKSDTAFGTIFRINKCFQRSKQKVNIYFSV